MLAVGEGALGRSVQCWRDSWRAAGGLWVGYLGEGGPAHWEGCDGWEGRGWLRRAKSLVAGASAERVQGWQDGSGSHVAASGHSCQQFQRILTRGTLCGSNIDSLDSRL